MPTIKILHGALQPSERGQGSVLRGLLDPECLHHIEIPINEYQRGDLHEASLDASFVERSSRLPDVDLGMRGHRYTRVGDTFELVDPVEAIDGAQRIYAALRYLEQGGDPVNIEIGATIHFDSDVEWEKARFEVLNRARVRVASDLLLRNRRHKHRALVILYELTNVDRNFPLFGRVSWTQNRTRRDLLGAFQLLKTVMKLHMPFCGNPKRFEDVIDASDLVCERIGAKMFKQNIETFIQLIEDTWGIRDLPFKTASTSLKDGFLACLTRMLAEHEDFWRNGEFQTQLIIPKQFRNKLKSFELSGHIADLASGGGETKGARVLLYEILIRHINSGRRNTLKTRKPIAWPDDDTRLAEVLTGLMITTEVLK